MAVKFVVNEANTEAFRASEINRVYIRKNGEQWDVLVGCGESRAVFATYPTIEAAQLAVNAIHAQAE